MIGIQFTIQSKAHPERIVTFNDHSTPNFIALQTYPTFDLEVRNDEIAKEGQHGTWDFFSFYGKRLVIFEGVIVGENEAEVQTLKDALQLVTMLPLQPTSGDDGTVIIKWTDSLDREVQTEAKISSPIRYGRPLQQGYRLDFLLTLKSPNPQIESQELTEVDGVRGYPLSGLSLPFSLPTLLSESLINKFQVENEGNTLADTVIRLYGSANRVNNNPRITNLTTGQFMQVNVELTDETEFVVIDTRAGSILDQDGADLSGSLEVGSTFVRLQPGVNELIYLTNESVGENGPVATRVDPDEPVETEHRFGIL